MFDQDYAISKTGATLPKTCYYFVPAPKYLGMARLMYPKQANKTAYLNCP